VELDESRHRALKLRGGHAAGFSIVLVKALQIPEI